MGLRASELGRLTLLALKRAASDAELLGVLHGVVSLLAEFARQPGGLDAIRLVFRYVFEVSEVPVEPVLAVLQSWLSTEAIDTIMTTAPRLPAEGRTEGLEEGIKEGRKTARADVLIKQLTLRFGTRDEATVARVRAAPVEELDRWTELVLTADSVAAVLS